MMGLLPVLKNSFGGPPLRSLRALETTSTPAVIPMALPAKIPMVHGTLARIAGALCDDAVWRARISGANSRQRRGANERVGEHR
jgi:hypothetical protein